MLIYFLSENIHLVNSANSWKSDNADVVLEAVPNIGNLVKRVKSSSPNIIVVDVSKSRQSYDLISNFRILSGIPVFCVSKNPDIEIAVNCLKSGALDYVVYENSTIQQVIDKIADTCEKEYDNCYLETHIQTVRKLRREKQQKSVILQRSPIIYFYWNPFDNNSLKHITESVSFLGYTQEEFLTGETKLSDLLFQKDMDNIMDLIAQFDGSEDSHTYTLEIRVKKKDGTLHWVEDRTTVLKMEDGSINCYTILLDIESYKQTVIALKESEEKFKQAHKMEAIGRLAGGIAHDFNNLLTTILGYSDLALMTADSPKELENAINEIKKSGERAASLTHQLLAFSRKQIMKFQDVDLNKLILNLSKMLKRLIGEDILFQTSLKANLKPVYADNSQLEQVIMNLVVNARDAMPKGGSIIISTKSVRVTENSKTIRDVEVIPGQYIELSVSDDGCGMHPDMTVLIFEPFFTTKEQGKGTGLGLSTVYGIVKQTGGYIWVDSNIGEGTTFKILLPTSKNSSSLDEENCINEKPSGGNETILVVEDEETLRILTVKILEKIGYNVYSEKSGNDALKFIKETNGDPKIDLIITDVVMPGMNGFELAQHALNILPELKLIYFSGYTDSIIEDHGIFQSSENFLAKPFTTMELSTLVRSVLDSQD